MNERERRGRDLAARFTIERKGNRWLVPSQTGSGTYTVDVDSEPPWCNCSDYELRGLKCKHLYAVEYTIRQQRETCTETVTTPDTTIVTETVTETTTKTKRITYRQDWPAYNTAQTQEKALYP